MQVYFIGFITTMYLESKMIIEQLKGVKYCKVTTSPDTNSIGALLKKLMIHSRLCKKTLPTFSEKLEKMRPISKDNLRSWIDNKPASLPNQEAQLTIIKVITLVCKDEHIANDWVRAFNDLVYKIKLEQEERRHSMRKSKQPTYS